MPFQNPDKFTVRRVDPVNWKLREHPLVYVGNRQTFVIPVGYKTDFASVPWWVQSFIPRTGVWTLACVLHDWLITHGIPAGLVTSREADGIFRRVLREEGTGFIRRWCMWTGVRLAAPFSEGRRPAELLADSPALAAVILPILSLAAFVVFLVI